MDPTLHFVTTDELPTLKDWLSKYLPESFKLHSTVCETLRGRWRGTTFYTLGWPDIVAVGEGPIPADSPCFAYHTSPRHTSVYAPTEDNFERLLLTPGFIDWSQPLILQIIPARFLHLIEKITKSKKGQLLAIRNVMLEAKPEKLPARPIPDNLQLRCLDPDDHTEYAVSTWPHTRIGTDSYIRQLLRCFPSVGLFNKDGDCIGLEVGNDYGAIGMLHVREEHRGQGLGKIITSQLAQKYFVDGLPVTAFVIKENESSVRMHTNCGFEERMDTDYILYHTNDIPEYLRAIGYKGGK